MQKFSLTHDTARQRCIEAVKTAPDGSLVTIREGAGRNLEQNDKAHAVFSDISKQVEWHGRKMSVTWWKRLITAAYMREIGNSPELVPALDGHGFDIIFEHTSEMPKSRTAKTDPRTPVMNELIEWALMFGAQNGVQWSEKAREE